MLNTLPRPKPKPVRAVKTKKRKNITSICSDCGALWRGGKTEEWHEPFCQHELPIIVKNANKTERQMVCEALDEIMRLMTTWRDGVKCVIHGNGCYGPSQWGHVIPQGSCSYLVYEPSNSFRQSASCNELHRRVQAPYYDWYRHKFGNLAYTMLIQAWKNAPKGGMSTVELWQLREQYATMYNNRHVYSVHNLVELVEAGFYGNIIREAWIKEGRI